MRQSKHSLATAACLALGSVPWAQAFPTYANIEPQIIGPRQVDPNLPPAGESTANIPRPLVGNVPYGMRINSCTVPGKVALTFDDGPGALTNELLDLLDEYDSKVTFFVTGVNLGVSGNSCSTERTALLKRMHDSGHQIGQHTWSHPDLVGVPIETFNTQMYYAEMAFRNILGLVPTYARPPYFSCDDACYARYGMLGYHAIIADVDTNDWNFTTAETHQAAKDNFVRGMAGRSWTNGLVLAHDVHEQTVRNLTRFMLDTMREQGVGGSITVGECLQDPVENWYRAAGPVIECPPG